jgi:hypothetical protein
MLVREDYTSIMMTIVDSENPTAQIRRWVFESAAAIRRIWMAIWEMVLRRASLQRVEPEDEGLYESSEYLMGQAIEAIAMTGFAGFEANAREWMNEGGGTFLIRKVCVDLDSDAEHLLWVHWPSRNEYARWVPEVAQFGKRVPG